MLIPRNHFHNFLLDDVNIKYEYVDPSTNGYGGEDIYIFKDHSGVEYHLRLFDQAYPRLEIYYGKMNVTLEGESINIRKILPYNGYDEHISIEFFDEDTGFENEVSIFDPIYND